MARETNDEARMRNDETNPNDQIVGRLCQPRPLSGFAEWSCYGPSNVDGQIGDQAKRERESQKPYKYFDLRHSFDIRHSDFVINKIRVYSCAFVVNH
jgi:hypothetical protein